MTEKELKGLTYEQLKAFAAEHNIEVPEGLKKPELIQHIITELDKNEGAINSAESVEVVEEAPIEVVEETSAEVSEEAANGVSAFELELKRRRGGSPSDAFGAELARRQGQKVSARTFEQELQYRSNRK